MIGYTLIASEDDNKDLSTLETPLLLRWKDVQSYNVWPPYQVILYTVIVFEINTKIMGFSRPGG